MRAPAQPLDLGRRLTRATLVCPVIDHDIVAALRELDRDRASDAPRRSGHQSERHANTSLVVSVVV
jgi:hypothetical protein